MDIGCLQPKKQNLQPALDSDHYQSKCFHGFLDKVKPKVYMFDFMNIIGVGNCGQVYRAKCATERKCEIAIKVIPLQGWRANHAEVEEKNVHCLIDNPHPNIIEYFGCFDEQGKKYIVMEIGQCSLEQLLDDNISHLSIFQFHEIMYQVFELLNHLDSVGVFQNDFCWKNMVYLDRKIKLIDFDLMLDKESPEYVQLGDSLDILKNAADLLASLQLKMKYKSNNEKYFELKKRFSVALDSENFTESNEKSLLEDSDIWHEELPIETRKILSRCFTSDKSVRRDIIENRHSITSRNDLVF